MNVWIRITRFVAGRRLDWQGYRPGGSRIRRPREPGALRTAVVSRAFDGINRSNVHLFQRVVLTPGPRRRPVPSPGGDGRASDILYFPCNRKKNRG